MKFPSQRHSRLPRPFLHAAGATALTALVLLALLSAIRWGGRQALQSDASTVITQTSQQLVRTLQSRRGTLTFVRDLVSRQEDLTPTQLQAIGRGAVEHTRHLLGLGLIREGRSLTWWAEPTGLSDAQRVSVQGAALNTLQRRRAWRVPSTFSVILDNGRILLVLLEPLRQSSANRVLIGAFDLQQLLSDFFTTALSLPYPAELLDGTILLYRSPNWQRTTDHRHPLVVEQRVALDGARWTLHLQPGRTRILQTLSWFRILLIGLSLLAAAGVLAVIWLLTARAWILERAVTRRTAALRRTLGRLRQMAITDELTGLSNRRFFLTRWEWECQRAQRYGRPLTCLMIDVNSFKFVNDRLGHPVGDRVLQRVAEALKTVVRQSDVLARLGGDEFVIALPETGLPDAERVAEKLRALRIAVTEGAVREPAVVTLSVGIGGREPGQETADAILEAADRSLYRFKHELRRTSEPHEQSPWGLTTAAEEATSPPTG